MNEGKNAMKFLTGLWLSLLMMFAGVALAQQPGQSYNASTQRGTDSTATKRKSVEDRTSATTTGTVSINGALLSAYIRTVEAERNPCGNEQSDDARSWSYVEAPSPETAKVIRRGVVIAEYPPYHQPRALTATKAHFPVVEIGKRPNELVIVRAEDSLAHFKQEASQGFSMRTMFPPQAIELRDMETRNYLYSAIMAHATLSVVAEQLTNGSYKTPDELAGAVMWNLCHVDKQRVDAKKDGIQSRVSCGSSTYPTLDQHGQWTQPLVLNCGAVVIDAERGTFTIDGRPTLSQESIDGRDIRIAYAREGSKRNSVEQSSGTFKKNTKSTNVQRQD